MPKRTGRPWSRVKAAVIRRDGGRCHLCGELGADTADHLVPVSHGGALYAMSNLAAAHHNPCNLIRGDRDIEEARARIAAHLAAGEDTSSVTAWSW